MIEENLKQLKEKINSACQRVGRKTEEIVLVCVTKKVKIERIRELLDLGITDIGESYVQDALNKFKQLKKLGLEAHINWHMVGHLQKNKAKYAVRLFNLIHSVDSFNLAVEVDRCAQRIGKLVNILIQVNISGETSKFGISPEELRDLVNNISNLNSLRIKGLMTITPFSDNPEANRPFFRKLRLLKEKLNNPLLSTLSMGMTQDFEVAIEEGANMLRIGRAIFDER